MPADPRPDVARRLARAVECEVVELRRLLARQDLPIGVAGEIDRRPGRIEGACARARWGEGGQGDVAS